MLHNKTFAWAYGGMPYFGYEIFKQDTTNAVMAGARPGFQHAPLASCALCEAGIPTRAPCLLRLDPTLDEGCAMLSGAGGRILLLQAHA